MKRWIGSLVLLGVASLAIAQGPFTIARPVDGARVREKVRILIPKGSIPTGGYVGVFLNDRFLEAVVPPVKGRYHEYVLDTKGRGLEDTPAGQTTKLEFVLYAEANDKARIVDRSSVNLRISNYSNIPVPNDGLRLRYRFVPGDELVYNLTQTTTISEATEAQNSRPGNRAASTTSEGEKRRISYAVVNAYGDGDGLLRMQLLPTKGKDYADITVDGSTGPARFVDLDMSPIYMRITSTGLEEFGTVPAFFPTNGISGQQAATNLFASYPLPTLPTKAIRPGDSWRSRFQRGAINLNNIYEQNSVIARFPARGEFVRVEWERGHPCAIIRHTIEAGTTSPDAKKLGEQGVQEAEDKVGITETMWFAMDTRKIIKIVRDSNIERKNTIGTGGLGNSFGGGVPGGFGGPRPGGMPGGGGGRAGRGDDLGVIIRQLGQGRRPGGFQGGPPPGFGGPGGPSGMGGFGGPGGPGGQFGTQAQATYTRIRILQTFTLEG